MEVEINIRIITLMEKVDKIDLIILSATLGWINACDQYHVSMTEEDKTDIANTIDNMERKYKCSDSKTYQ